MNCIPGKWEIVDNESPNQPSCVVAAHWPPSAHDIEEGLECMCISDIARVRLCKTEEDPHGLSNARLIAAAPDLLDACKQMLQATREHAEEMGRKFGTPSEIDAGGFVSEAAWQSYLAVYAAVIKAEGRDL